MSQENVEIVKAWYDAFNREDWETWMNGDPTALLEVLDTATRA